MTRPLTGRTSPMEGRENGLFGSDESNRLLGDTENSPPMPVRYHKHIDARILRLVEAAVHEIDASPALFERMRGNVSRWSDPVKKRRWERLLDGPWARLREQLLSESETGAALRQDAPLGGILSPAERNRIMRQSADDPRAA
ncbi:MAG: hypothetical protein FJW31_27945 [Acidobacteria bacterium]|nr:hypothetical protein [Acidobacteriota bacterium]